MEIQIKDILASPQLLPSVPTATLQQWTEQYPHIPLFRTYAFLNQTERDHTNLQQVAFYTHNRSLLYKLLTQTDSKIIEPSVDVQTTALPTTIINTQESANAPISVLEEEEPITAANISAIEIKPEAEPTTAIATETPIATATETIEETSSEEALTPPSLSIADRIMAELQEMKAERERRKTGIAEIPTTLSTEQENSTETVAIITTPSIGESEVLIAPIEDITISTPLFIPETEDKEMPKEMEDNFGEEIVTADIPDTADNTHYITDEAETIALPITENQTPIFIPTVKDIVITADNNRLSNILKEEVAIEEYIEPDTDITPSAAVTEEDVIILPIEVLQPISDEKIILSKIEVGADAHKEFISTENILPTSKDALNDIPKTDITEIAQTEERPITKEVPTETEANIIPDIKKLETDAPHTFVEWLQLLDGQLQIQTTKPAAAIEEKEWIVIPRYEVEQTIAHKKEIQSEESKLFEPVFEEGEVDLFNEIDQEVTKVATESVQFRQDMMTETLAKIYTKQGKTDKALEIYNALLLKFPEKSAYFAVLIEKILKEK